ncbi:MAG: DEAD/DEAH box helicase family protein [Rhodothermales bacterium]|nr:DEAD/DEAH box helicase family protein [Rhodothermales bacterium]
MPYRDLDVSGSLSLPLDTTDADGADAEIPGIAPRLGFRFRAGQARFLSKLAEAWQRGAMNHLGVFVPGYGKTITALASFVVARHLEVADRLVVFVPRGNLRDQYADPEALADLFFKLGAPLFSFCVADADAVFLKNLSTQIIVTTYQYASGRGGHRALLRYTHAARCLFVFDEVHHLADDGTWAQKIEQFPHAASVALSGTPMRSDNKTLFGVPFEAGADGEQYYRALHEVTLRDAHAEGRILKRVAAHVLDYRLRMVRVDTGEEVELSLSEMVEQARSTAEVDTFLARKRLRFHDVYLDSLLRPAFERLAEKQAALRQAWRQKHGGPPPRQHQMLVIAMSNRHAAAILAFVREHFPGVSATRIGQDVAAPERAARLDAYRNGEIDVMVQVDMIGEGTDIKPISVIVKADLVRAASKTMQQVFRGMRYYDGFPEDQNLCDLYAADDSEVVETLAWITSEEQRGVTLRQRREPREAPPAPPAPSERSAWELKAVEQRRIHTHSLDSHFARTAADAPPRPQIVDVSAQERALRQSCAELATELAFVLRGTDGTTTIRDVHAAAMRRFAKPQDALSLPELDRKQRWLERCLRARRLL